MPPPSAGAVSSGRAEPSLRLTLAPEVSRWQEALARLGAATTDLMAPITLALPSGLLGGLSLFWIVLAVVAVLYLTVGTLVLGTTPGLWMMQRVGSQPLGARRMPLGKATGALGFGDDDDETPSTARPRPDRPGTQVSAAERPESPERPVRRPAFLRPALTTSPNGVGVQSPPRWSASSGGQSHQLHAVQPTVVASR